MGARTWQYWRYVGGPVLLPVVPRLPAAAVRQRLLRLRHRRGADRRHRRADADPDRGAAERQRAGRPAEPWLRARPDHGRHHRDRHDRLRVLQRRAAMAAVGGQGGEQAARWLRWPSDARAARGRERVGRARRRRRPPAGGPRRSFPVWRWAILLIAAVYFLIPLYAALHFAGLKAFTQVVGYQRLRRRDRAVAAPRGGHHDPHARCSWCPPPSTCTCGCRGCGGCMEGITILPIVIPPIVLIIGVLKVAPGFLLEHAVPARAGVRHPGDAVRVPVARRRAALIRPEDPGRGVELARRRLADHAVAGGAAEHADRDAVGHRAHGRAGARRVHHGQPGPLRDLPGVDRAVRAEQRAGVGRRIAARAVRHLDPADAHRDRRRPERAQARRGPGRPVHRRPSGSQPDHGGAG